MTKRIDARGKRVLFISDLHIPYSVKGYIRFLKFLLEVFKPDIVICLGDMEDNHGISFHDKDADLFSAGHELQKTIIEIQEGLHKLLPRLIVIDSNHGSLIYRKIKHHGIPIAVIKPIQQIYETPEWEYYPELILETDRGDTLVVHNKSSTLGKIFTIGMNVVQGHYHTRFEIVNLLTAGGMKFSMICGCLADRMSMAMAYSWSNIPMFINGTGGLQRNGDPVLFPYEEFPPDLPFLNQ